ncbi:MAG: glycoside hydrolase family 16 protein [bacterium]
MGRLLPIPLMRLATLVLLGAAFTSACSSATTPSVAESPRLPQATWVQVWSDEFDGPPGAVIDSTKWSYQTGDGCSEGICGWGNSEKESYTISPSNVALNGQGQLAITARSAPSGLTCYYGACRYTSAKITTRGKLVAAQGRVEARIRIPSGQGLWPAFWMLGSGFPGIPWPACGEFDIMENKGSQRATTSSAIHGPGYSGATPFANSTTLPSGAFADDFHTYAVEWDSSHVAFSVDGTVHYGVSRSVMATYGAPVLDNSYYIILNLAVGGFFDGDPASDAILPATMLVDYVRVYRAQAP